MINILWLFNDLLDLYGDRGNILAIKDVFDNSNIEYNIDLKSLDDEIDFNKYQLVYIGPGKDKNLIVCSKYLNKYQKDIKDSIERGCTYLSIGNSLLLFGKEIIDLDNNRHELLNIFDIKAKMTNKVYTSDFIAKTDLVDSEIYGFINRTLSIENNDHNNLFEIIKSSDKIEEKEGIHYKNFYGTFALGPLLVKNPDLLKKILSNLIDIKGNYDLYQKAHDLTIKEFK